MAPTCANCGKPIPKYTETVYAPGPPGSPVAGWTYRGNGQVLARRYVDVLPEGTTFREGDMGETVEYPAKERRLWQVTVWDGESYLPRHGHFCSVECAAQFGRAAVDAGFRRTKA